MSAVEPVEYRRAELCKWFTQSPGRSLLAVESHALRAVWPSLFSKGCGTAWLRRTGGSARGV